MVVTSFFGNASSTRGTPGTTGYRRRNLPRARRAESKSRRG